MEKILWVGSGGKPCSMTGGVPPATNGTKKKQKLFCHYYVKGKHFWTKNVI